ncbi:MAG: hypothetical protein R3C14_19400 [Caldilineaceae bacterium]
MNTKKLLVQLIFALVLTIAATVGSGVVAEQTGIDVGSTVYACGTAGGGGC